MVTLPFDLAVKVPLYAAAGVPEVWVIDAATLRTHRFRRPADGCFAEEDIVPADAPLACGGDMAGREALANVTATLARLGSHPVRKTDYARTRTNSATTLSSST